MTDVEDVDDGFVLVSHKDADLPRHLADISAFIDAIAGDLWTVNKKIHDNPELSYGEHIAHDTLTSFIESVAGWKVTRSAYGIDTAWVAVCDSGKKGPVVSFNVEMGKSVR